MSTTTADRDIEVTDLELRVFGHSAPCDWEGHDLSGVPCSHEVTHLMRTRCINIPVRACEAAALWASSIMRTDRPCAHCGKPARECWVVVAI